VRPFHRHLAPSLLFLVVLCLGAAACSKPAPPPSDDDGSSERGSREDDESAQRRDDRRLGRELVQWLKDAQARSIRGDDESYYRAYAADGQITTARAAEPSPYDYSVPVTRFLDWVALRGKQAPAKDHVVSYEDEQVTIEGESARVGWTVTSSWREDAGAVKIVYVERYRLAREDAGWRVKEKRVWNLSSKSPGAPPDAASPAPMLELSYDAAYWAARDRDVETARGIGLRVLVYALIDANRVPEAHQLTKTHVETTLGTAEAWYLRGECALRLGLVAEAKEAFAKAARLDPTWKAPPPFGPDGDKRGSITDLLRHAVGPAL
jgi:hypothetical protein